MSGFWDDARIETLRNAHREGLSYGQIAGLLGISRKAIAGMCFRLGLKVREGAGRGGRPKRAPAGPKAYEAKPAKPVRVVDVPPAPLPVAAIAEKPAEIRPSAPKFLPDLRADDCRFPLWDDSVREGLYCAASVARGSWCADHARLVFGPGTPSERRAHKVLAA